jgi:outer membrane lipoprotein-sorting protein
MTSIRILALLAALLLPASVSAQETLTAKQIVALSAANRTVSNSEQTMTLKIFDKRGASRTRTIESRVKESEDGITKSLVKFTAPSDVSGVQFLSVIDPKGDDIQWLYFPEGDILNRISGSSRRGSFMGTDFSFEDLEVGQAESADHTKRPDEVIEVGGNKYSVWVIESVPHKSAGSAYSKLVSYIDKVQNMPRRVDFFDKKGNHIKQMTVVELEKSGDILVPKLTVMKNIKKGTHTEIRVESYRLNVPAEEMPDDMFTAEFLRSEG